MAKKKNSEPVKKTPDNPNVMGLRGEMVEQPITETLEINFMPYAMSVIMSRAIPEIDGFKPSHRKLLYTMYKMGLLTGGRTKSANIVGQTMRLNPHGDAAIYETMVRLSKGYEALLTPFVDSKGHGVLFRGNAEAQIRKYLVAEKRYIKGIIGLPANLFFGTGIPACIIIIEKSKAASRKGVIRYATVSGAATPPEMTDF